MNGKRGPSDWLLTYTGKVYWPLDPRPEEVCVEDLAHGLSMLCRYAGQTRHFYSVAEHSIHVSRMVPPELALEGLLHDAAEAYLCDIIRPLKRSLPDYQQIEKRNEIVIRSVFGLPHDEHLLVKQADTNILITEYRDLMPPIPESVNWWWDGELDPSVELKLWCPTIAEEKFLERFHQLRSVHAAR